MHTKFFSQFSAQQLRDGYARNVIGIRAMLVKAEETGRKVNGFTADYLREKVAVYERLASAPDADILAHVGR